MDSIMVLKDHNGFKFVHGNLFPRAIQRQNICLQDVGNPRMQCVELVKRMQLGRDMEES